MKKMIRFLAAVSTLIAIFAALTKNPRFSRQMLLLNGRQAEQVKYCLPQKHRFLSIVTTSSREKQ